MEVIKLNLIPTGALPVVHASQYDDGRIFRADLYDGAEVYHLDGTETISCELKKPDGNIVTLAVTNTSESFIEIQTTEQTCAVAGESLAEVKIQKGNDKIGSLNFILSVERSPIEGGIESESEINNLWTQVDGMVADALATQYDSANVVFDNLPTEGHGIPYTVTSEGIGNAIDNALDMTDTASGAIATFESEYALPLRNLEIEINAVQESGTPTPSSPKAISGFTGANIGYCDFNQLRRDDTTTNTAEGITTKYDGTTHLVSITNDSRTSKYSSGSTQITLSTTAPIENHVYAYLANTDEEGVSISQTNGNALKQTDVLNTVFKGVSGATGFRLRVTNLYDFVSAHPINNTFSFYLNIIDLTQAFGEYLAEYLYSLTDHGVSIVKQIFTKDYYAYEAGGTKVSIESINGSPYPNAHITWQDEAGTVYGGSLDVTSGVLTVTHGIITFDGSGDEIWNDGTIRYSIEIPNCERTAGRLEVLCNRGVFSSSGGSEGTVFVTNTFLYYYPPTSITSLADFKTWLGSNNLVVVYPLATPVTYQLTPTQISAIVGTNNVFTDTNGDTTLEYYTKRGEQTVRIAEGVAVDVINNKNIDTLATTDKTVKGAINELAGEVGALETAINNITTINLDFTVSCRTSATGIVPYRSSGSEAVNVANLTGYPTGKTILAIVPQYSYLSGVGNMSEPCLMNVHGTTIYVGSYASGDVDCRVTVIYKD